MSSPLDSAIDRHPSLRKPLADLIDFLEAKQWGDFTIRIKNGRVYHYLKTTSVEVAMEPKVAINNRQSEDREAINGSEG